MVNEQPDYDPRDDGYLNGSSRCSATYATTWPVPWC